MSSVFFLLDSDTGGKEVMAAQTELHDHNYPFL